MLLQAHAQKGVSSLGLQSRFEFCCAKHQFMYTSLREARMALSLALALSFAPAFLPAQDYHVSVNVNNTKPYVLPPFYSGFASNEAKTTWRYNDPLFIEATQSLYPKMIRWPGGASAKFDWHTGDIPTSFIERSVAFGIDDAWSTGDEYKGQAINRSKGGTSLLDFSNLILSPFNAKAIIAINSITDIPQFPATDYTASARELAAYVRDNGIRVAYFDLMNEPYLQKKIGFFEIIAQQLGMTPKTDEHLGHFNGRVYVAWVKLFSDAIKSEMPDAKTAVMFSPGKLVSVTYNGETDDDYCGHFDQAIWDYAKNNGPFWDAISFHWYPAAAKDNETVADAVKTLAGNPLYLNELIQNYYIANNTTFGGKPDMPILISELNVSSECLLRGTLYDAVFLSEILTALTKFPQVKNVDIQSLAPNSALSWGSFKLKKTLNWQTIASDAYNSTPNNILPSVIPFYTSGLLSFTEYPDLSRPAGLLDLSAVSTLPNASTDPSFKDYEVYFSAHGRALQIVNKGLSQAQMSYDVAVTAGTMATVAYGPQPVSPFTSEIGSVIMEGASLSMRAFRDVDGTGRLIVVNKSAATQSVDVSWGGKPVTGTIVHDWIGGSDYLAENSDNSQDVIVPLTETVTGQVTIGPYSVNLLTLGYFPRSKTQVDIMPYPK